MSTKTLNKTSFGMYAPLDYETYMKLKKIRAVANMSYVLSRRCEKWGRKMEKNRYGNCPKKPCSLFYDMRELKEDWSPHSVLIAIPLPLNKQIIDAYDKAQPVKTPEELQEVHLEFDGMHINELYHRCLKWYNDNFK